MNVETRYMQMSDLVDVADISRRSSALGWDESEFVRHSQMRNVAGYVAVRGRRVLGYVVIRSNKDSIEILNMDVHPEFRRNRVGCQLIARVLRKLNHARRKIVHLSVPERAVGTQLFLKRNGFEATATQRGSAGEDDSYLFERGIEPEALLDHKDVAIAHG